MNSAECWTNLCDQGKLLYKSVRPQKTQKKSIEAWMLRATLKICIEKGFDKLLSTMIWETVLPQQ